jgi:hypothetical protein
MVTGCSGSIFPVLLPFEDKGTELKVVGEVVFVDSVDCTSQLAKSGSHAAFFTS